MNLYQKYRPSSFKGLVAQEHVKSTLVNAIEKNMLSHAYLFCGPRGTGKTSTARLLAKAINCTNRDTKSHEPCNSCFVCEQINLGSLVDLVEIDAASNRGVDEIRELRESVKFAPTQAQNKVYIIDEVHMLTKEAFNALLKTLEEPPSNVFFILATTELHKIPDTIVSRCQRFGFRRIFQEDIVNHLESICKNEKIKFDIEALKIIAKRSEGCMRDALSLLDQVASFSEVNKDAIKLILGASSNDSVQDFVNNLISNKINENMEIIQNLNNEGVNFDEFSKGIIDELQSKLIDNLQNARIYNKISDISVIWMKLYNDFRINNNIEFGLQVLCIESARDNSIINSEENTIQTESNNSESISKLEINQMIKKQIKDLNFDQNKSTSNDEKLDFSDVKMQLQIYIDQAIEKIKINNANATTPVTSEKNSIGNNLKEAIKISDSLKVEEEEDIFSFEADTNFKIADLKRSWKKIVKKATIPKLTRLLNEATLEKSEEKLFLIFNAHFFLEQMDKPEFIRASEKLLFEHGYAVNIHLMLKKDWIKKTISSDSNSYESEKQNQENDSIKPKTKVKKIEPVLDAPIERKQNPIKKEEDIPLPEEQGNYETDSEEDAEFALEDFFDVED